MLDVIRRKKDSIVVKAVFVIIALSFVGGMAIMYSEYQSSSSKGGGFAAKVDRTVIGLDAFQSAYNRNRDLYRTVYGANFTPEIEKGLGLKRQALEGLIDSALVLKGAKELGVSVSKDEIAAAIAAMPTFQRNGVFDLALYQQTLKMNRITPKDFEEAQRAEILQIKTRKAVMDKAVVSDEDALKQFHKERDKRQLIFASFAAADVASEVKMTDAELNEYMEKNASRFKTPEKVAISYFVVPFTASATAANATDEEIRSYYDKNLDRYLGKDNLPVAFEQVKDRARADLLKQKAAKQLYEKVADTLYQNEKSGDLGMIAGKLGAKVQDTGLFVLTSPPAALAGETSLVKKAFEVSQGAFGGPVETSKGIYVFKVKEKKPAELPPLSQVRGVVEQQLRLVKAAELAKDKAIAAQKRLVGTDYTGLKLQTTPLFAYSAKGEIPSIGISVPLAEAVSVLTAVSPAPSEPVQIAGRWYAVRLKTHDVASEQEFPARKDEIKRQILPKKQQQALDEWLKGLRGKAKIVRNDSLIAD